MFKFTCDLSWQGEANSTEKFSIRGDGLTTATTAEADVSAIVASAGHSSYAGVVFEARTTQSVNTAFLLFKVVFILLASRYIYIQMIQP